MGQIQAQTNSDNNINLLNEPTISDPGCYHELTRQFEAVLCRAKSLGLEVLEKPLQETASSLKDLKCAFESSSTKQKLLGGLCHCEKLSDVDDFICAYCDDKRCCDADALNREQSIKSSSDGNNHVAKNVRSTCKSKCSSNSLPCWGCHYSQVKGKIKDYKQVIATKSSSDDPITRSHRKIVIVETPKCLSKAQSGGVSDMTGRLACTCECGNYFQEGEFKNCPCGCGQVVEIIDDSNHYSEPRQYCENAEDTDSQCTNFPNLLMDTKNNDSGVMTAVEFLQMKCRLKDGIITVLAEELRNSGNIDKIIDNLAIPCLPHTAIDFDRSILHDYLKRQSLAELHSVEQLTIKESVLPPSNFRVVRSILNSLYLVWDLPFELCNIRGYEILVNGVVTSRVRSATRCHAILTPIDLTRPTLLTLYSVAINGHISEALTIIFPDCKYKKSNHCT